MANLTVNDYLDSLDIDKHNLVGALRSGNVIVDDNNTFTELIPKVSTLRQIIESDIIRTNEGPSVTTKATPRILKVIKSLPSPFIIKNTAQGAFAYFRGTKLPELQFEGTIKDFSYMYYYCENVLDFTDLQTTNATNMDHMYYGCQQLTNIPNMDTSNVTNMQEIFSGTGIQKCENFDASSCTTLYEGFERCDQLKSITNLKLSNKMQRLYHLCDGCSNLETFTFSDDSDLSGVTDIRGMLSNCNKLVSMTFPDSLKNITSITSLFSSCRALKTFTGLNTSNVDSFDYAFLECRALESIPALDMGKALNISYMFNNCNSLKNIEALTDLGKTGRNMSLDLRYCHYLTEESVNNIINSVYDVSSLGTDCKIQLSSYMPNYTVTDDDKQRAAAKGWTLTLS